MKFALCSDNPVSHQDKLRDPNWCRHFPGSGWVSCLYAEAELNHCEVASGDVAIDNVESGMWQAKDIYVLNDMNAKHAKRLVDLGAKPFLLTCFESPLYAPTFYDEIELIARKYYYKWIFGMNRSNMNQAGSTDLMPLKFPSFYLSDFLNPQNWETRKLLTLIAENKYKARNIFWPSDLNFKDFLRLCKYILLRITSTSYRCAIANSLHDQRLTVLEYFMRKGQLDLYGSGWNNLGNMPKKWAKNLGELMQINYFGRCEDKLGTLAQYRFSICYENMALPGYMTEKIIDCFVAGTIPIYLGDPKINDSVPKDAYIDAKNFSSLQQLNAYLLSIDGLQANRMIQSGRNYLYSQAGSLHVYENFAKNVIKLAQQW